MTFLCHSFKDNFSVPAFPFAQCTRTSYSYFIVCFSIFREDFAVRHLNVSTIKMIKDALHLCSIRESHVVHFFEANDLHVNPSWYRQCQVRGDNLKIESCKTDSSRRMYLWTIWDWIEFNTICLLIHMNHFLIEIQFYLSTFIFAYSRLLLEIHIHASKLSC